MKGANARRPTEKAIEIPKDHMDRVLNSVLCERMLGFERRLNDKMDYEWRGQRKEGWSEWSEALVDFAGDLLEAQRLLHRVCRESGLGYNLIYDPRNDRHSVVLMQVGEGGKPIPVVQIGGVSRLSQGIAVAICGHAGFDLVEQHKLLHPGNYLLLS